MTEKVPRDWRLVKLKDVSHQVKVGLATSVTKHYAKTGVPIVRNLNIKRGYLDDSDMLYLKEEFANAHPGKYVKAEDVLTVHTGYIGISCVVPGHYAGAHTFTTLITTTKKKLLNPFYFSYHLNSYLGEAEVQRLVAGAGRNNLNVGDFVNYRLLLPPIEEQEEIVNILSSWDRAIAFTEQRIGAARQRKKGLMQRLLTGRVRFLEFEGEEWQEFKLEEVCESAVSGGTPSTQIEEYWSGTIPWITGADFTEMKVSQVRRYITEEAVANSSTKVVNQGDLLLVSRTGVGKIAIAPFDVAVSQDITGITPKTELVDASFLLSILEWTLPQLARYIQGTSINGVTRRDLMRHRISLPSLTEQRRIAAVLQTCDREIELLTQKRDVLQRQKKGLMQRLLTGRVRVSV